jgi:hypothetical protein
VRTRRQDGTERECDGDFSLLSPHICRVAQSASSSAKSAKASNKRKRKVDGSPDAVDAPKGRLLRQTQRPPLLSG